MLFHFYFSKKQNRKQEKTAEKELNSLTLIYLIFANTSLLTFTGYFDLRVEIHAVSR